MKTKSPFHAGEIAIQTLAGETLSADKVGKIMQPHIPSTAFAFLQQQTVVWIGLEGSNQQLWTFPLSGSQGFTQTRDGKLLTIAVAKDALPKLWADTLKAGQPIACLAIEFSSRKRIRINGIINKIKPHNLTITVQTVFPNCPKYIRKREQLGSKTPLRFKLLDQGHKLSSTAISLLQHADTAFVSSCTQQGADVSHRGGETGFIQHSDENIITLPDYKGNGMFSTLGNIHINNNASLLVVNFEQGFYLQLQGFAEITCNDLTAKICTGGTHRYWTLQTTHWYLYECINKQNWESLDFSPFNPCT